MVNSCEIVPQKLQKLGMNSSEGILPDDREILSEFWWKYTIECTQNFGKKTWESILLEQKFGTNSYGGIFLEDL